MDGCTDKKKTLEKRRNRTSSSRESSTSPEPKKQRSDNVSVNEEDETNETDDEIFAALNMAEGFHKTLLEINQKLEKLDIIQEAVTEVQTSLHKLEVRMQNLESSQETANRDIDNLKTSLGDAVKKSQKSTETLEKYQNETNQALKNIQKENEALDAQLKELEDKNLYLEAYSRRENLKFENIMEEEDKENTEAILRGFLETELGYKDANTVEIQRVHRLGRKQEGGKPRSIIARFLRYKDCEGILSLGSRLRGLQNVSRFTLRDSRKKEKANGHF